jgi:hypothetical protein
MCKSSEEILQDKTFSIESKGKRAAEVKLNVLLIGYNFNRLSAQDSCDSRNLPSCDIQCIHSMVSGLV